MKLKFERQVSYLTQEEIDELASISKHIRAINSSATVRYCISETYKQLFGTKQGDKQ